MTSKLHFFVEPLCGRGQLGWIGPLLGEVVTPPDDYTREVFMVEQRGVEQRGVNYIPDYY